MTDSAYPPQRPLTVSEVLDLSFRIYRSTVIRCLLLSAFGVILAQLGNIYSLARGQRTAVTGEGMRGLAAMLAQMQGPDIGMKVLLGLIGVALSLLFYGAVLIRQQAALTGKAPGGELLSALRRLPGIVGLTLLVALCMVVCFLPMLGAVPGSGVGTRLLLILICLIAVSYAVIAVSCSYTVFYVEGAGALDSLVRSFRLTTGSFWRLSGIYSIAAVVLIVAYMLFGALAGFIGGVFGHADVAVYGALLGIVGVVMGALATPFYTAMGLAVLGDLRARKEGADLERRISAA